MPICQIAIDTRCVESSDAPISAKFSASCVYLGYHVRIPLLAFSHSGFASDEHRSSNQRNEWS